MLTGCYLNIYLIKVLNPTDHQLKIMSQLNIFLVVCCYLTFVQLATAQYQTIALTGEIAPGTSANFTEFSQVNINNSGNVAFRASSDGGNGVWVDTQGQLELIVQSGSPATPIGNGVEIANIFDTRLNDSGVLSFSSGLSGNGVENGNNSAVWTAGSGGLTLLVREGDPAPGIPGNFGFLNDPIFNNSGESAFPQRLVGLSFSNDDTIWSKGGGSGLTLIAREGSPAPGTPAGVDFFGFLGGVDLNDLGQSAFRARIVGPGIGSFNDGGIWRGDTSGISPVVLAGDPAPGTDDGVVFLGSGIGGTDGGFSPPILNNFGQVAFFARLIGSSPIGNNRGIWAEEDDLELSLIVRQGDPAPGIKNVSFSMTIENLLFNDAGQVAFIDQLSGAAFGENRAIWLHSPDSGFSLVAREGNPAPGTSAGVNFDDFADDFGIIDVMAMNNLGQVAFRSDLTGAVNGSNDRGIWATDLSGNLKLVVRTGDLLDVNEDPEIEDLRTISGVSFVTGQRGRQSGFNDSGQLAFVAFFTDGTRGVFVSDVVAIDDFIIGDVNGDGEIGFLDISPFISRLSSSSFQSEADVNQDGEVNFLDISPFIVLLSGA